MIAAPVAARADVDTVTASPPSFGVNVKDAVPSLPVTWNVNRSEPVGVGGPFVRAVSSPNAQLLINGTVVATLAGALNKNSGNLLPGQSETVVFPETLTLNAALAQRVARAAPGTVVIRRMFNDTLRVATGEVQVYAALGNSGALAVRRIELAFENDARTDVVNKGESMRAVADISFRGNGLLRGEWRLVDSAASLGGGAGRLLKIVRQDLVSAGEGRVSIVSPPLPTDANGLYLLSFSVQDTAAGFEIPILRYFVIEGHGKQVPLNVTPLTPGDGAVLGKDTVFSWKKLPDARAYQVEVFARGGADAVAGQLVPHTDQKLTLSGLVLEDLKSGDRYEWRVRAFNDRGQVIGESGRRGFKVP